MLLKLFAVAVLLHIGVQDVMASKWTMSEIAAMPPYCAGRYARTTNPAEYRRWEVEYGSDFLHTHHLCDAIGLLGRYPRASNAAEKREVMKSILGNLNYMFNTASPDFKLMPDVYYYRSQAHLLSGNTAQAVADLRKMMQLYPSDVRAYVMLAEHLERQGQRGEALKVVSDGLKNQPDASRLQRLYTKLGGVMPYPGGGGKVDHSPTNEQTQSARGVNDTKGRAIKRAVFDFNKPMYTGVNALAEAGAYVFVEVREEVSDDINRVRMIISSQIPQPAARVVSIGIDMGRFSNMISSLRVENPLQAKYYLVRSHAQAQGHSFWPKFNPTYEISFTRGREEKNYNLYDPRALPPGSSLTLLATLNSGYKIDDLVEAIKLGTRSSDGMRLAIIANHTKGYRPNPKQTIMDDGGYIVTNLRQMSGFDGPGAKDNEMTATNSAVPPTQNYESRSPDRMGVESKDEAEQTKDGTEGVNQASAKKDGGKVFGSPSNPWCRFCPEGVK